MIAIPSLPDPLPLATILQDPAAVPAAGSPEAAEGGPTSGLAGTLAPLLIVVGIFWFLLISPERKQRKKREAMLATLEKGSKVMTSGGLYGTVAQIQDDVVTLQVDDGVRLRFARSAIQTVIPTEAEAKPAKK